MKFLYKIYSRYDGFVPGEIPRRMDGDELRLGWSRYIESVNKHDKVLVYFHGPGAFDNGVYLEGTVQRIEPDRSELYVRVSRYQIEQPLTSVEESLRISEVVAPRNRQVFLYPQDWVAEECSINTSGQSCRARQCDQCPNWSTLRIIDEEECGPPRRLPQKVCQVIPAYWVIPSRCFLGWRINSDIRRTSDLFYRFKVGDDSLAYPLARGIFTSLQNRHETEFDCIIPIPLSPDKANAGEINRTLLLARELSLLLDTPVTEALSLKASISKRRMLGMGVWTIVDFRRKYFEALNLSREIGGDERVLLVDDVCTEGTTLSQAHKKIISEYPKCQITAATAGQMIVKHVTLNEAGLRP